MTYARPTAPLLVSARAAIEAMILPTDLAFTLNRTVLNLLTVAAGPGTGSILNAWLAPQVGCSMITDFASQLAINAKNLTLRDSAVPAIEAMML